MAKFDLAAVLGDVSKLDTGITPDGREQIEYIDIALIDPDPNNFYELSSIDELAASIELLGIQQPLRVRDEADNPGRVMIVSGHRRRAALELLVKEGKDRFASVPCIREANAGSAALQELRLIYANSDTRRLSSAEISKQAERVETLLYQLKEEGMEFPGRMRDHVAEACKVSKSKLARLKVIRDNLDKKFKPYYEKGTLSESVAYALAQHPVEIQRAVYTYKCGSAREIKYLREWEVGDVVNTYTAISEQTCKKCKLGKCSHTATLLGKIYDDSYGYKPCAHVKCCDKCERLASCKNACPMLKEKIQQLKADKKAAAHQEKLANEERDRPYVEQITKLWARFGQARVSAGKSVKLVRKIANMDWTEALSDEFRAKELGTAKITPSTSLPYSYNFSLIEARRLIAIADLFGCSLDYLFCRTDEPAPGGGSTGPVAWTKGAPTESGLYVMETDFDGMRSGPDVYRYDADTGGIRLPRNCYQVEDMVCLRYIRLPED